MPAQKKTSLGLNQWIGSEYPKRIDFVEDNKIINDELENRVKYTDLAEENKAGIITYAKIKEIAPKPDLSPYIPFSKGYRNTNSSDFVLRGNSNDCWTPHVINMFNSEKEYTGALHTNGGRAYYKVPNRNGGNWCEIMDNHDMVARDIRMNNMDTDRTNLWNKANDAWNKAHDAQVNRIYEIRLAGYVAVVIHQHGGHERAGYVVTGVAETTGDYITDIVQMRALQFNRNGQWINTPFV